MPDGQRVCVCVCMRKCQSSVYSYRLNVCVSMFPFCINVTLGLSGYFSLFLSLSHTQARRAIERRTKKGIEIEWKKKLTDMNGLSARAGQRARRKHAISWRTTMKYPWLLVYLILRLSVSLTRPTAHRCYSLSLSALPQSLLHVISVNVRRRHSPFGRRQWLAVYLIKTSGMNTHLWNHLCFCFAQVPFIFWSDLCNLSNKRVHPHKTEREKVFCLSIITVIFVFISLCLIDVQLCYSPFRLPSKESV